MRKIVQMLLSVIIMLNCLISRYKNKFRKKIYWLLTGFEPGPLVSVSSALLLRYERHVKTSVGAYYFKRCQIM